MIHPFWEVYYARSYNNIYNAKLQNWTILQERKVRSRTKSLVRIGQGATLFPDKGGEGETPITM